MAPELAPGDDSGSYAETALQLASDGSQPETPDVGSGFATRVAFVALHVMHQLMHRRTDVTQFVTLV